MTTAGWLNDPTDNPLTGTRTGPPAAGPPR